MFNSSKIIKWQVLFSVSTLIIPLFAQAQTIQAIVVNLQSTFNQIVIALFILATLVFIWSIVKYILAATPETQSKARALMIWSIVGLAVIAAGWGAAQILVRFFGAGGVGTPTQPGQLQ